MPPDDSPGDFVDELLAKLIPKDERCVVNIAPLCLSASFALIDEILRQFIGLISSVSP